MQTGRGREAQWAVREATTELQAAGCDQGGRGAHGRPTVAIEVEFVEEVLKRRIGELLRRAAAEEILLQLVHGDGAVAVAVDGVEEHVGLEVGQLLLVVPVEGVAEELGGLAEDGRERHRNDHRRGEQLRQRVGQHAELLC